MKPLYALILSLLSFQALSQSTPIPDPNFEQALAGIDSDGLNGSILNSDAANIVGLNLNNKNISDLSGIEAFVALQELECMGNNLTSVDFSSNTMMKYLAVQNNELTSINLDGIVDLQALNIHDNYLTSLDLSTHPNLQILYCYANELTSLDVSNNTQLFEFLCGDNEIEGVFDISNLISLNNFSCSNNKITGITLGTHFFIETFSCSNNKITWLDFNATLMAVENLYVDSNELYALNLKNQYLEFSKVFAQGNPDLNCILVNDSDFANAQADWHKDGFATYEEVQCNWLGTSENAYLEIELFPNPAEDQIVVRNISSEAKGEIVNLAGQNVKTVHFHLPETVLQISELQKGVYFLKINNQAFRFVKD